MSSSGQKVKSLKLIIKDCFQLGISGFCLAVNKHGALLVAESLHNKHFSHWVFILSPPWIGNRLITIRPITQYRCTMRNKTHMKVSFLCCNLHNIQDLQEDLNFMWSCFFEALKFQKLNNCFCLIMNVMKNVF